MTVVSWTLNGQARSGGGTVATAETAGERDGTGAALAPGVPGTLELDELLEQLIGRAQEVLGAQGRLRGLLRATQEVAVGVDLEQVLRHIVVAGRELVGARYAALGVVSHGRLVQFVHEGIDDATVRRIGELPAGKGILGRLVDDPRPLRLRSLDEHPASTGFPAEHPPMGSFLGVPIRVRDRVFGNIYLTEKQGAEEFTADDEALVLALAAAAGVAIENAMLFTETQRRQAWQSASTGFTTALLGGEEPTQILERVVRIAAQLGEADGAALLLPTDDPGSLFVAVTAGELFAQVEHTRIPVEGTLSGLAHTTRRPVVVDDLATDPRLAGSSLESCGIGPAIAAPLSGDGHPRGVLAVVRRHEAETISPAEAEMISSFALHSGLALELARARLDQETGRLAAERERIAEQLNADVMSELLSISTGLYGALPRIPDPGLLATVREYADRIDRAARRIGTSVFDIPRLQHDDERTPMRPQPVNR